MEVGLSGSIKLDGQFNVPRGNSYGTFIGTSLVFSASLQNLIIFDEAIHII